MSKYVEIAQQKRSLFKPDGGPVYNCAQAVVCAFTEEIGLDEETCRAVCTHFGGGMRIASVCGAVTGALMTLGLMGCDDMDSLQSFYKKFKANHDGMLDCADLLRVNAATGTEKLTHCNALIFECVTYVEEILRENGKLKQV